MGSTDVERSGIDEGDLLAQLSQLGMIGRSPSFVRCLRRLTRLASFDAPTLISGETGTGKELAARAIHYLGARRGHAFVPLNCGAVPDALFESELFGYQRGAFTDAKEDRVGLIALAEGGTLFLDEVDSLTAKGQVALLRFLQDRTYRPVGGRRECTARVTVIAATNRDLAAAVAGGGFRRDLYYRLHVGDLRIPPLRERPGDLRLLARHFLRIFAAHYDRRLRALDEAATASLESRPWPGNVRELENVLHRAFLLSDGPGIGLDDLAEPEGSEPGRDPVPFECPFDQARRRVIDLFERSYLDDLMRRVGGNVSSAARLARKERRALGRLLVKHNIDRRDY